MKHNTLLYISFFLILLIAGTRSYSQLSLSFAENKGQWPDNVLFKSPLPQGALFLEKNGMTFTFYNPEDIEHSHAHNGENNEIHNHKLFGKKFRFYADIWFLVGISIS